MCGLYGYAGTTAVPLQQMADVLKHRGPDYAGTFVDEHVHLGHSLLAIREKAEASHQPYTHDPTWVLLFVGQIYNTAQLKKTYLGPEDQQLELDTVVLYKLIVEVAR